MKFYNTSNNNSKPPLFTILAVATFLLFQLFLFFSALFSLHFVPFFSLSFTLLVFAPLVVNVFCLASLQLFLVLFDNRVIKLNVVDIVPADEALLSAANHLASVQNFDLVELDIHEGIDV